MRNEPRLLIVEDNPDDVAFLRRALSEHGLSAHIAVATDGDRAIEYLEQCTPDRRPHVVVIDINLPKRDGIEVLRKCRFTPSLIETKTMVLTSSGDLSDQRRADVLGANAYVRKPRVLAGFAEVVAVIRVLLEGPQTV